MLVRRLGEVLGEREDVLDMAAAISAGHDGVLVATDERLLFVALRRSLSFGYANISSVAVKGRWFGSRLTLATPSGKGVFSGLAPRHAAELAELAELVRSGQARQARAEDDVVAGLHVRTSHSGSSAVLRAVMFPLIGTAESSPERSRGIAVAINHTASGTIGSSIRG